MKLGIIFAALVIGLVAFGQPAVAAKPAPSGTIAIAAGSDLNLGGFVSFDYTVSDLPTNASPRVELSCYQDTDGGGVMDDFVYTAAGPAGDAFLLGGTSSLWIQRGGPAECTARLYYWDHQDTFVQLAGPITFSAGG